VNGVCSEGKGGRQRVVPVSGRFFASLGAYLEQERPATVGSRAISVWCGHSDERGMSVRGEHLLLAQVLGGVGEA
jgi:integrase/recombinase XerD